MEPDIIDRTRFARRLHAARVDAGFDNMIDLANRIQDERGVEIAASTLYAYESGRTIPSLATLLVIMSILHPHDGFDYFKVAIRSDISEAVFNRP